MNMQPSCNPAKAARRMLLNNGCQPRLPQRQTTSVQCQYRGDGMPSNLTEDVSSLQNATVKHCVKVRTQRSYRESSGTVIVSGADLLAEISPHVAVQTLFHLRASSPPDLPTERCVAVTEAVMQKITGLESVAPGALAAEGTLLRTALGLGWDGAFLLPGCADPFNDKAIKASRGAAFKLPIAAGSLQDWRAIVDAHELNCVAAEPHRARHHGQGGGSGQRRGGKDVPQQLASARVSLVLGSEGQGLTQEVLQHCTPVAIAMGGDMESLNVGAAGAIFMWALSEGAPALLGDLAAAVELLEGSPQQRSAAGNGSR